MDVQAPFSLGLYFYHRKHSLTIKEYNIPQTLFFCLFTGLWSLFLRVSRLRRFAVRYEVLMAHAGFACILAVTGLGGAHSGLPNDAIQKYQRVRTEKGY